MNPWTAPLPPRRSLKYRIVLGALTRVIAGRQWIEGVLRGLMTGDPAALRVVRGIKATVVLVVLLVVWWCLVRAAQS